MPPRLNQKRARFVLSKIDEILAWERRKEAEKDTRFVELWRYLCEVRAGQYWRLENLKGFDDFLERRFPESRRKAYYLMSIHEHLPPEVKRELKQVGWTKGLELAKLARSRNGQEFKSAIWLHKAKNLSPQEFQREVEKELTGHDSEPWEIVYFKLYKSQMPVIEQAIETAAMMLGSDAGLSARWLAMSILRIHAESSGPSPTISRPLRRRYRSKSDYPVPELPLDGARNRGGSRLRATNWDQELQTASTGMR